MATQIDGAPAAVAVLEGDESVRQRRRDAARRTLGFTEETDSPPLRPVLREHDVSLYPMLALGMLTIADSFQAEAFSILTPEISRSLGLSLGAIAGARTLAFLGIVLAPLPMAALAQRRGVRAALCIGTALLWSIVTLYTGMVTSLLALILVLVVDGLSSGSVSALHTPLLVDSYPPQARVRVLSGYSAMKTAATILSPLLVALLAGPLNLNWRGVFLGLGLVSLAMSLFSLRLTDPGPGKFDTEALRAAERERVAPDHDLESDVQLGFFEIVRRILLIPTVARLASGYFALGVLLVPFATYLSAFLEVRWSLSAAQRGVFFSAIAAVGIGALLAFGKRAEAVFRRSPATIVVLSGWSLMGAVVFIAVGALMPSFSLMFVAFAIGQSCITVIAPSLTAVALSVIDARYRPHAAAVFGIFTAAGSILGVIFLSGLDRRLGLSVAIASLMLPGFVSGLIVRSAAKFVDADLDRMIDEVLEGEDVRAVVARGGTLPLLGCRGIDFSYGQLQVLFDVDFTVEDGEMVALLGTNGAGKSTLLNVLSGIGLPSAGTVRFRGQEITYLDAERRVPLGITQIPGGKAVFGTLDVVENLRLYGHTIGRDKARVDAAIDECFEAFPRLYERRDSLAATMSGGERQMLALSKALILRPQLLLIDELSLGLAPIIVGPLLDMVRRINDTGTAVVLVEQSVNIALSLVDHAYFMEKGEMRFDGRARELLARGDLLRAVFLDSGSADGGGDA